ncbi:Peptidyl-prolyl cis-trans isomerase FKBP16-3, chloroplastic [Dichanthelium oligosanthes]|uniref:peptidylprolyl isomerase n=1 Tax=Dichanthelium oligosanthes TaxID=888268 RepID=A0A1E5WJB1_9POAL|nr:Peptidyl-prolyl cis-trans isomerase FKBP16-3, chloroplastic [Dichanthelium oligosanthes]
MAAAGTSSSASASPLLLPSGPRRASASRPWLRGGSAFRSRALGSDAPCCCKAAAGGSAAQCGAADDFVINSGSSTRRGLLGMALGASALGLAAFDAVAAGLPPEEKPKLCDAACESELENVGSVSLMDYGELTCLSKENMKRNAKCELPNAIQVPMVTTESGLQYKDIKVGEGPSPPVGFQVAANCVAMVPNGQIFDSSLEKGQPYIFRVGAGQVIPGLDEGILSMKVGGLRRLYIPGPLAFPKGLTSAPGRPRVPPSSPVVFDVNLLYIPGLDDE